MTRADLDLALGDQVEFLGHTPRLTGEVVSIKGDSISVVVEGPVDVLGLGNRVAPLGPFALAPHDGWIGRVIDPWGQPMDDRPIFEGPNARPVNTTPPAAAVRRGFGGRLKTGLLALNTVLPLVRGQRIGLFAGAGVGKSTLIGTLANDIEADVVVVGLVGERGREVGAFVRQILGDDGMARSVVVAATSDQPA
ncbi:MAG: flagellum-specific ATP synthase FliI, partial [Pseudomonadota bacterium]